MSVSSCIKEPETAHLPIEDPILHVIVSARRRVRRLSPIAFYLIDKTGFVRFCGFLRISTLGLEVGLKLRSLPIGVGRRNFIVPAALDQIFQIGTVCGSWIWDIVIREPSFELSLMPLVVSYMMVTMMISQCSHSEGNEVRFERKFE